MSVVANVAVNVDARNAIQQLRGVQLQAQQTERAVSGLSAAIGKAALAFAAIQAIKFTFVKAAEIESQTRSLQVLTGSAEKATQIIKQLQDLGAVTPFTSTELIDAAKRLQAFGVEANNVVDTTRRLADVSGATGAELQGLVTAYGQVQAKGRLQGEELLQFQERGVALQKVLRDEYKLSGEQFQDALSKGRISAEAVEYALKKLTDAGGKYANGAIAQSDTLQGKLSTLQDSFQRLAQNIGTFFAPVFKFLIDGVNAFIERVNSAARLQAGAQAYQEAATRTRAKYGARVMNPFDKEVQDYRARLEKSLLPSMIGTGGAKAPSAPAAMAPPPLLAPTRGGGRGAGGGKSKSTADATARIQAEIQGLQRQTALTKQLTFLQEQIADAEAQGNKQLVIQLQQYEKLLPLQYQLADQLAGAETAGKRAAFTAKAIAEADQIRVGTAIDLSKYEEDRQKQFQDLLTGLDREIELNGIKSEAAKQLKQIEYEILDLRKQGLALTPEEEDAYRRKAQAAKAVEIKSPGQQRMDELQTSITKLTDQEQIAVAAADNIGQAFGTAFQDIVTGASTGQEALANMMNSIGQNFINMAAQIIAQQTTMIILGSILKALGISTSIGGGATSSAAGFGGSFDAGIPALPSVPDYSGAFRADGGAVSAGQPYTVGERGPELFVPSSSGGVLSNSDLRQTMAGGMGGSSGSPVLNMNFETTSIGGVEYVSRDQLELAMAETRRQAAKDGARRGMTMTLDKLQQSPQTRSRIGLR